MEGVKGTVGVKSNDPPCKSNNARYRAVLMKPISEQFVENIVVFLGFKVIISDNSLCFPAVEMRKSFEINLNYLRSEWINGTLWIYINAMLLGMRRF